MAAPPERDATAADANGSSNGLRARLSGTLAALADPNMARLMLTWGAWCTAEWAFLITVSVLALDAGGPAAVGLVGAVRVLPAAVLGGFVAGISDRLPRPLVLAAVHTAWSAVAASMAWLAAADGPLPALLLVVGVGSAVSAVFKPCIQALLPQLVHTPAQLIAANSAYSTVEAAGTVAGPALCGIVLAWSGPPAVFVTLAVLYVLAAGAAYLIRTPFQPARRAVRAGGTIAGLLAGVRFVTGPGAKWIFWLFMLQTTMRGLLNVFVIVLAARASMVDAGTLFAAVGVGGLVGVATVTLLGGGGRRGALWFAVGITLWGLPVAAIGALPEPGIALAALALLGLGNAVADIFGFTLFNRLMPDHIAGRAWGAFHTGGAAAVALGSLAAPVVISAVGLSWAMGVTGVALALAPVVVWPLLRGVEGFAAGRPGDVELLQRVALFAPLSLIAIERLARVAVEIPLVPGEAAVRQGEIGTTFFVVAQGSVSVVRDGRPVRQLGAGDSFGEIALMDAVPRTASIVADEPTRLLCIGADAFVAAVTGHRDLEERTRMTIHELRSADAATNSDPPSAPPG